MGGRVTAFELATAVPVAWGGMEAQANLAKSKQPVLTGCFFFSWLFAYNFVYLS